MRHALSKSRRWITTLIVGLALFGSGTFVASLGMSFRNGSVLMLVGALDATVGVLFLIAARGQYEDSVRDRRKACGECVKCGYPLRGLTSERCPECGQLFSHKVPKP